MGRFNMIQNSFLSGELGRKLYGRVDLPDYFRGCSRLENAVVMDQGGAFKRPGSRHMREVSNVAEEYLTPINGQKLWVSGPEIYISNESGALQKRGDFVFVGGNSTRDKAESGNKSQDFPHNFLGKFNLKDRRYEWIKTATDREAYSVSVDSDLSVFSVGNDGTDDYVDGHDTDGAEIFKNTTDAPTDSNQLHAANAFVYTLFGNNIQRRSKTTGAVDGSNTLSAAVVKRSIHGGDGDAALYVGLSNGNILLFNGLTFAVDGSFSFTDADGYAITDLRLVGSRVYAIAKNGAGDQSKVYCLNAGDGSVIWVHTSLDKCYSVRALETTILVAVEDDDKVYSLDFDNGNIKHGLSRDPHPGSSTYPIEILGSSSFVFTHTYIHLGQRWLPGSLNAVSISDKRRKKIFDEYEKQIPFVASNGIPYLILIKRADYTIDRGATQQGGGFHYNIWNQLKIFRVDGESLAEVSLDFFFYTVAAGAWRNVLDVDSLQFAAIGDVLVIVDGNGPPVLFAWESELRFSVMNWFITAKHLLISGSGDTALYASTFRTASSAGRLFRDLPAFIRAPYQPRNASDNLKIKLVNTDSTPKSIDSLELLDGEDNLIQNLFSFRTDIRTARFCRRAFLAVFSGSTEEAILDQGAMISSAGGSGTNEAALNTDNFRFSYWGTVPPSVFPNYSVFTNPYNTNWPRTVTTFQQRLIFGGSQDFPQTLWGSMVGNILHMMQERLLQDQGVSADVSGNNYFGDPNPSDPFAFTIASTEASNIAWILAAGNSIEVGTTSREYLATGGEQVLSSENALIRPESRIGSAPVQAVRAGRTTFFVDSTGRRLHTFEFDNDTQSMRPRNLMSLSDAITDHNISFEDGDEPAKIVELVYQETLKVIWCRTSIGEVIGCTYDKESGAQAWHRLTLGRVQGESVKIKGMCVLPNESGGDELYLTVWREFDGNTSVSIEKIGIPFDVSDLVNPSGDAKDSPIFSDSSKLIKSGGPISVVTGLDHLEGKEVVILADGFEQAPKTVSGGSITLDEPASEIIVGLKYRARIALMPFETQGDFGDTTGELKRIHRLSLRFYRTWDAVMSVDGLVSDDINLRDTNVNPGDPIPEFSGIVNAHPASNPEKEHIVEIFSEKPFPMTLVSLTRRGVTYG